LKPKKVSSKEDPLIDPIVQKSTDNFLADVGLKDQTEMGQVLENLDSDTDQNTRITSNERSCIMIIESLLEAGVLPKKLVQMTPKFKRLSVALKGMGRGEKVTVASANRGAELSGKSGGLFSGLFKPKA